MPEPEGLPCPACRDITAMLGALADWVEDGLAAGMPAKWLVREATEAVRAIAGAAGPLGCDDAPTVGITVSDDITMLIRQRPEPLPSGRRRGGRLARYIRRRLLHQA